jgi:Cu2+-exporting ATPase
MEMKARRGTTDSLRALFDIVPPKATVLRDGREVEVDQRDLRWARRSCFAPATRCPSMER